MKLQIAAVAIVGLVVAWPARATTVAYTVDGWGPQHFAGTTADTPAPAPPDIPVNPSTPYWGADGYPGDKVELQTYTGTFDLVSGITTQKINTLLWTGYYTYAGGGNPSDPNADWQQLWWHFTTPRNITIDGQTTALAQGGLLEALWDNDYLSFQDGSTASLYVDGYRVEITPLGLPSAGAGWSGSIADGVPQPDRDLMAQFTVEQIPEPSTIALVGLGVFGTLVLRRRKA